MMMMMNEEGHRQHLLPLLLLQEMMIQLNHVGE
jgi:hypothetical protein